MKTFHLHLLTVITILLGVAITETVWAQNTIYGEEYFTFDPNQLIYKISNKVDPQADFYLVSSQKEDGTLARSSYKANYRKQTVQLKPNDDGCISLENGRCLAADTIVWMYYRIEGDLKSKRIKYGENLSYHALDAINALVKVKHCLVCQENQVKNSIDVKNTYYKSTLHFYNQDVFAIKKYLCDQKTEEVAMPTEESKPPVTFRDENNSSFVNYNGGSCVFTNVGNGCLLTPKHCASEGLGEVECFKDSNLCVIHTSLDAISKVEMVPYASNRMSPALVVHYNASNDFEVSWLENRYVKASGKNFSTLNKRADTMPANFWPDLPSNSDGAPLALQNSDIHSRLGPTDNVKYPDIFKVMGLVSRSKENSSYLEVVPFTPASINWVKQVCTAK